MDIDLITNIIIAYLLAETIIGIWNRIKFTIFMILRERNEEND